MTAHENAQKAAIWVNENYEYPFLDDGVCWEQKCDCMVLTLTDAELIAEAERLGWKTE